MIAVLGTGLLGAGFVAAFRKRGVAVRAWNRSLDKAQALEPLGVEVALDPASAVRGVERVHLVLSDDAAIDAVLEAAMPALTAPVIDHSTASPAGVARRFAAFREAGRVYVHAPVFMGPQNARDATGMMLISGPPSVTGPLEEPLRAMTGKLLNVGERVDLAAAFKLFGNSMMFALVAAASDVLTMARALGIDEKQALSLFEQFDPSPAMRIRGARIVDRTFQPAAFELVMARKDARLMLETTGGEGFISLPAIAERMDERIAEGHGQDDLAAIGRP